MTFTSTAFLCLGLCLGRKTYRRTETLPKPTIWAEPSSVVTPGTPVDIWCRGSQRADQYYLYRTSAPQLPRTEFSLESGDKAKFSIPLMTQDFAGTYHCLYHSQERWSVPSEPLNLMVAGMFHSPTLSAFPGPIVTSGGSATLQCGSWQRFDWFYLWDEGGGGHYELLASQCRAGGWRQALFTVGPVSLTRRWTYGCYGVFSGSPYVWSSPSDLLELQISGVSRKPSLSLLPGPVVVPGDTLTLRCQSDVDYNRFALFKKGEHNLPQRLSRQVQAGLSQADFSLGPVSGSHGGQYTCYGGYNLSFHWSAPIDPVNILVTGEEPLPSSQSDRHLVGTGGRWAQPRRGHGMRGVKILEKWGPKEQSKRPGAEVQGRTGEDGVFP
ncbi:leukocyte immunoglobulin-like receptor subfamily A member 2 [Molossus nigricans]